MARKVQNNDIDLSAIKNVAAIEKVEPKFEETVVERTAKLSKGSKFNFTESDLIPLPSGGRLYKNVTDDPDILNGNIRIASMTAKEEEILSTTRFIRSGAAIRMILDRCITSDIQAKDILLFDSNYLMFHLRRLSYGDEYTFDIKCQNTVCGKKFKHTVNISSLEFEELDTSVDEPIEVLLPRSQYTVKVILPRLYHSEELTSRNANRKKKTDDEDKRMIDNIVITTVEVLDNNGEAVPKRDWEEFYEALPAFDIAELRDRTRFDTGVDTLDDVVCPFCGEDYSGTIPIGTDFFRI